MRVPQIRLQTEMAQISISQRPANQSIKQPPADLTISQPEASVSINQREGKLTIDQTQAWEDMGLYTGLRSTEVTAQRAESLATQGTQRRARQGDELMRIENEGNPIPSQALLNGHDQMRSIGLEYIPSRFAVKINYQPAEVSIDVQPNAPQIDAQVNRPEHNYEPGTVNVQLEKYQSLDIDFVNLFSETI